MQNDSPETGTSEVRGRAQVSGQPLEVANGKKRGKGDIDLQETDSPPLFRLHSGKLSSRTFGCAFIFALSLTLILGHDFLSAHFFNALTRHTNCTRTNHIWT